MVIGFRIQREKRDKVMVHVHVCFPENEHKIEQINSNFGFDINNKAKNPQPQCLHTLQERSVNILAALTAKKRMSALCKAFWNIVR